MPQGDDDRLPFETSQTSLNRSSLETGRVLSGQFWGELRTFLVVVKAGSFNKASVLLNTSHPTVSRQVKRLQDLMEAQLIIATKQGIQLTQRGRELAAALADLDHKLFDLSHDLRLEKQAAAGRVSVSITEGLASFFLVPALAGLSATHPAVQVSIENPVNLLNWRDNQTDVGLTFAPVHSSEIVSKPIGFLHLLPVASRGYVERQGAPSGNDLSKHAFIQSELYAARTGLWAAWQDVVARGRVAHASANSMVYGLLVRAGLGIGLLGNYTLAEREAVALDLDVEVRVPMFLVATKQRLQSRPVRIVYDLLDELFGESNVWFSRDLHVQDPDGDRSGTAGMLFR